MTKIVSTQRLLFPLPAILLVEDEERLRSTIRYALANEPVRLVRK